MDFLCTISSVGSVLYRGKVVSVTAPGSEGEVTILSHHSPLVSKLKEGEITVRNNQGEEKFSIQKGILEVHSEGITILVS